MMDGDRIESLTRSAARGLGLLAVAAAMVLAWPGIRAARADEPDRSVQPGVEVVTKSEPSFEGFARHLQAKGKAAPAVEDAGPTCSQPSQLTAEMVHRQAYARLQAELLAAARAGRLPPPPDGVVMLNGRGYNYRAPTPGMPAQGVQPGAAVVPQTAPTPEP